MLSVTCQTSKDGTDLWAVWTFVGWASSAHITMRNNGSDTRIDAAVAEFLEICAGRNWTEIELRLYLIQAVSNGKLTYRESVAVDETLTKIRVHRVRELGS